MNEAFIQQRRTRSDPCRVAAHGLEQLGYVLRFFEDDALPPEAIRRDVLVVGGVGVVFRALRELGVDHSFATYPEALQAFMASTPKLMTLADARRLQRPFFMKPVSADKRFGGSCIEGDHDLLASAGVDDKSAVFVVAATRFVAEHRCFVQHGVVVGCRAYKGHPLVFPDPERIQTMVASWADQPIAWALDVGVTADGRTLMVEVNDAHSIGDYGFGPIPYARFLEARWCELTGATPIP